MKLQAIRLTSWKWLFLIFLWLVMALQIVLFLIVTEVGMTPGRIIRSVLAEPVWFVLPYVLLRKNWRWVALAWCGFWTVVMTVNSFYQPNFDTLATFKTAISPSGCNSFVIEGAIDTLSWRQPAVFLPWVLLLAVFLSFRKRICASAFSVRAKWLVTVLSVIIVAGAQLAGLRSYLNAKHGRSMPTGIADVAQFYNEVFAQPTFKVRHYGFIEAYLMEVPSWGHTYRTLSADERARVDARLSRPLAPSVITPADNRGKNLIFIVVESLNTLALEREEAAPFLRGLMADSASFTATDVTAQIGPGRSADGQFVYNSGLLPLTDRILTESYASADYPSIAKALGDDYYCAECIGESKGVWYHYQTNESFGYDAIFDKLNNVVAGSENIDPHPDKFLHDKLIFERTAQIMKDAPQPFFFFVTTITMHDPYDAMPAEPQLPETIADDVRDRVYFERTRAFDNALAGFVGQLKEEGLYDNSVIVIAADHDARQRCLSGQFTTDRRLPLIILNSGINGVRIDSKINQSDVFPTILDIMGVSESYPWHGLGRSLLRRGEGEPYDDQREDWAVSRDLIQSGYFR